MHRKYSNEFTTRTGWYSKFDARVDYTLPTNSDGFDAYTGTHYQFPLLYTCSMAIVDANKRMFGRISLSPPLLCFSLSLSIFFYVVPHKFETLCNATKCAYNGHYVYVWYPL